MHTCTSENPHSVGRDALEPVVVEIEQHHLWLSGLQDEVPQLLHLEAGLERQLQLAALDHDVGEVQQVDLQWVQHAFPGHDDLFGLFLHRKRADEGSHLLRCLPLGQLAESFLPRPH